MVAGEPVMVELTVPERVVERGLVDDLVAVPGTFRTGRLVDLSLTDEQIADTLAEAAHSPNGFVARTGEPARALALLAATAAALCGDDIRTALATPDLPFLAGLSGAATAAVREVLLGIESESPAELERALRSALAAVEPAGRPARGGHLAN